LANKRFNPAIARFGIRDSTPPQRDLAPRRPLNDDTTHQDAITTFNSDVNVQEGGIIRQEQLPLMVIYNGDVFESEWIMELSQQQVQKTRKIRRRAR
jgi:hypothetical protein